MTVRRRRWHDPAGVQREAWVVDVQATGKDGRLRRVQRVAPLQNRRAAEKLEHELRQELLDADERQPLGESPLLSEFATEFIDTYARTNNKPSEVESKRMILRVHLVPELGHLPLDKIGAPELEVYKAKKLKAQLARKTVNNHLTVLRKLLSTAVEWGKLQNVPQIKWMKAPVPEFDFLTFDEAERLINCAAIEWRSMITIALRTGLRLGELLALRWVDVDLDAGRLVVRRSVARGVIGTPKNGRIREVPLSVSAIAAFKSQPHRGELVFCGRKGEMLTKGATKRPLWSAAKAAGLRRIGWHVLRHTVASHLVMRGAPMKAVQELLGHSTMEMTMRYAHLSPDARRDAVCLLDLKESVTLVWQTSKGEVIRLPLRTSVQRAA